MPAVESQFRQDSPPLPRTHVPAAQTVPAARPSPQSPWTVTAALFLMVIAVGGSVYEHLVVDPVWPGNVAVIQPDHGGVNRKLFWMPLHIALTLALPLALLSGWRNPSARRWLLLSIAGYVAMRVWTMVYFVPHALRFEAEPLADLAAAQTWVLLSTLRLPLVLASTLGLWNAGRRLREDVLQRAAPH